MQGRDCSCASPPSMAFPSGQQLSHMYLPALTSSRIQNSGAPLYYRHVRLSDGFLSNQMVWLSDGWVIRWFQQKYRDCSYKYSATYTAHFPGRGSLPSQPSHKNSPEAVVAQYRCLGQGPIPNLRLRQGLRTPNATTRSHTNSSDFMN